MSKKRINPPELYDGAAFGLSQATVETELGLVFVSGQVAWNHQYETTETSVEGQARKALDNLQIALTAAGSSVGQLLQVRVYVRGEAARAAPFLCHTPAGERLRHSCGAGSTGA